MQLIVPEPSNFPAFLRPRGEVAVKELFQTLESTRSLIAERSGQAQLEITGLEPLPQDRRSLAFVQAVFKHNFSPSNIEDAIIALKDFQFEVESCQQTTELAFQQVWRVYDIVKSRTLQRRSSVSTISSISTQIPESSTSPQATTSFRKEIIDWLKRQDIASKSNFETPHLVETGGGARAGTSAEESTLAPAPESPPTPISRDQDLSRNRILNFFGLSRARQDEADENHKRIEPFPWTPPPLPSPQATERRFFSNIDVVSQQQPLINNTTYSPQFQPTIAQPETPSFPVAIANYGTENSIVRGEEGEVFSAYFQAPPSNAENQHATEKRVYSNRDAVSQQEPLTSSTIYGHQFRPTVAQSGTLSRGNATTSFPIVITNYDLDNSNVRGGRDEVSVSYFQAPSTTLPPGAAQ